MSDEKDDRDERPLSIRFPGESWPKLDDFKKWYRNDSYAATVRLLLDDAHNLAIGNGVPSTSPLAPSVIQERRNSANQDGVEVKG